MRSTTRPLPGAVAVFLGLLLSTTTTLAIAATAVDIQGAQRQAERIQAEQQQRQAKERTELRNDLPPSGMDLREGAAEPGVLPDGGACWDIREIVINGAANLSDADRDRLTEPYLGQCLGAKEIERLLSDLTAFYVARGFVTTRVYLPRQDLSTGRLELLVIEGVVERIEIHDGDRHSVVVGAAFPGIGGEVLNLRDIEQGLDQINRLPSNDAKVRFLPGSRAGATVVAIDNQPESGVHLTVNLDNQGARSTGQDQLGATIGIDNFVGLGGLVGFTHRETVHTDRERSYSSSESVNLVQPYGYNTFTIGYSRSRYVSTITTASGFDLRAEGNFTNVSLGAEKVVYRDQSSRASLNATLTAKDTKNYLSGQLLGVSTRKLSVLDLGGNLTTGLVGGVIGVDLGVSRGLRILGALDDAAGLPDLAPRAQFTKYTAGVNYSRPFTVGGLDAAWSSVLAVQHSEDVLYGSEQMFIGGIYSVRGFADNSLSGDHGHTWRNDVSLRIPAQLFGLAAMVSPYLAFDEGRVTQRVNGGDEGNLSGMAVGVNLQAGAATWELFHSRPVDKPEWMDRETGTTYFRVSVSL